MVRQNHNDELKYLKTNKLTSVRHNFKNKRKHMKNLPIYSNTFEVLINNYQDDLIVKNKSESLIYNLPIHIREFFNYLETKGHENLDCVTTKVVTNYYQDYLSNRKNERRAGALSNGSLNKHQQALKSFLKYLKANNFKMTFGVHLKTEKTNTITEKDILTQDEIKELFEACNYSHVSKRFRLRDKALLAVLYSCGLRRNEAVGLDLSDIDYENKRIHIRSGSLNKKRKKSYIAINDFNLNLISEYIERSRPQFYNSDLSDALFVNKNGKRMQGQSMANRLNAIVKATENESILEKHIGLHSLRHSVATHLLQRGLSLEKVSEFLGHRRLESTQIYTHLIDSDVD